MLLSTIMGILILTGCSSKPINQPRIRLSVLQYDMGDIKPEDGIKELRFEIYNDRNENLKILNITTSCKCTTADVDSKEIPPNGKTFLNVTYDPNMHKPVEGNLIRIITIESDDPSNKKLQLEIKGNIVL